MIGDSLAVPSLDVQEASCGEILGQALDQSLQCDQSFIGYQLQAASAVKPPSDAQHGQGKLLDPRLRDIFISEILPKQPTWALGALRGTCSFLRDLLDSHATSHIWRAATQYQLWNQPRSLCPHLQNQGPHVDHGPCGMCMHSTALATPGLCVARAEDTMCENQSVFSLGRMER